MKNGKKGLIGAALVGVAAVAGLVATEAFADRTVVYTTANAKVLGIHFESNDNGTTISATVCGFTKDGAGNVMPNVCTVPKDLPSGALKTAIAPLFAGQGLTYWKNDQGL